MGYLDIVPISAGTSVVAGGHFATRDGQVVAATDVNTGPSPADFQPIERRLSYVRVQNRVVGGSCKLGILETKAVAIDDETGVRAPHVCLALGIDHVLSVSRSGPFNA